MITKKHVTAAKKIITGWWDKEPIWRYQTAEERLAEELAKRQDNTTNPKYY